MSKNGKRALNAGLISKQEGIFRCPICSSQMEMVYFKSLICSHRHCFDLAKQGYVNMLTRPLKTKYHKKLFEARKMIWASGFFDPLLTQISARIAHEINLKMEPVKILDAGCGEGSHLSGIRERIKDRTAKDILSVGVDIAKDAVYMAAKAYPHTIWCVADIAKFPFAGEQFDFIVNILAPANYVEFQRLLSPQGLVIEVIPERAYLQELREILYPQGNRVYTNDNTTALFRNKLALLDVQHVKYRVPLDCTLLEPLIRMTPLSWGTTEACLKKIMANPPAEITIDLAILFGKKKEFALCLEQK